MAKASKAVDDYLAGQIDTATFVASGSEIKALSKQYYALVAKAEAEPDEYKRQAMAVEISNMKARASTDFGVSML